MDRRAGLLKKAGLRSYPVFLHNENFGQTNFYGEYFEGDTVEVPTETILGPVYCGFTYLIPDIPYTPGETGDDPTIFIMPASQVDVYYE